MKRWKKITILASLPIITIIVLSVVIDMVVHRVIESVGTRMVGAKVELGEADLSFFPTGLTLIDLQVTDPQAPMQNAVEVGRMQMDLEVGPLLRRKVIVNELAVQKLRFNTPRQQSGAIATTAKAQPDAPNGCGGHGMPSFSIPDAESILARESLASLDLARTLEASLEKEKQNWKKNLETLADRQTLDDYQRRIEKLTGNTDSLAGILGAAGELQQLQTDIRADLEKLQSAQKRFTRQMNSYQQQVRQLAKEPAREVKRLLSKYSLTPSGLANLSQLLFGHKLCGWLQTAADWYARLEPWMGAMKGGNGAETAPEVQAGASKPDTASTLPDFLIRRLTVDAQLDSGQLTGKAENITSHPQILGRPTTFAFLGKEMDQIEALSLIGTLDFITPGTPRSNGRLDIRGLALKGLSLLPDKDLPVTLDRAAGDLQLDMKTVNRLIDGALTASFKAVHLQTPAGSSDSDMTKAIVAALDGIRRFSLAADIGGTLDAYTVDIRSDLDKILQSAAGGLVRQQTARLRADLNRQVNARMQGPLAQVKESLGGLGGIEDELLRRVNLGDDLLNGLTLSF